MRRILAALALPVLVAACGSSDTSGNHAPVKVTQTVRNSAHPTPETQPLNGTYTNPATGMQATIDLTAVRPSLKALGKPTAGYFWEVIKVAVHNGGTTSHQFNPIDFVLRGTSGGAIAGRVLPSSAAQLKPGQLAPGHSVSGWIAYLLSNRMTTLNVTWDDGQSLSPPVRLVQISVK